MDVGARTDGLSCFRNVLALQTQCGKRENKVTTGENIPLLLAKDLWSLCEREVKRFAQEGRGRWREGKVCSSVPLAEINSP